MPTPDKKAEKEIQRLVTLYPDEILQVLLDHPFWPRDLEACISYNRRNDENYSLLNVTFGSDGDGWIEVLQTPDPDEPGNTIQRFRNYFGGGESPRVHNALLMLALAIKLDNEERPQTFRQHEPEVR